ncbi:MAG: DUF502 domain-containing protein [Simkania sp.]|nr:DUF502 domain-containing protein [Simkania sp.]
MKNYLITGLIILLPIAFTLLIVIWLFDFLTQPFIGIIEPFILSYENTRGIDVSHHELLVTLVSRLIVLFLFLILIFLLGFFGQRFFFHHMVVLSQKILTKIPFIKTIYSLTHDVTKAFLNQGQPTFKETVLIPFPYRDTHALGLVTGDVPASLRNVLNETEICVFVPTAPHPISGYVLLAPKKQTIPVDMTTEETFRFLISCGIALPESTQS